MKLRNKKTGAIYSIEDIDLGNNADGIWLGMTKYNSLAELNEDWEDYTPAEPLIKDDKIRQIIKAWAKINEITSVFVTVIKDPESGCLCWELAGVEWEQSIPICFGGDLPDTLEDLGTYTIEELCGSSSDEEGK